MDNVIEMEHMKPHITLKLIDSDVLVIPVSLIRDLITGKKQIKDLERGDLIVRSIISDWLENL